MLSQLLDLATDFAFDSRKVKKGTLFFALDGKKHNGHDFLQEVSNQGAIGAVVSERYEGSDFGLKLYRVPHVERALQDLAEEKQRRNPVYVIGVTGTVGKTTTKEFLATLLSEKYRIAKSPGSANSQVSVPLVILNHQEEVDMLILEMGMSFPGELRRLTKIATPTIGLMTQISLVHSQNFEDIEAIARAKAELFESTAMKMGFFNQEILNYRGVEAILTPKISYSLTDQKANYSLKKRENEVVIVEKGEIGPPIKIPFAESHLIENFLAAVAVARVHDLSWEEIQRGAEKLKPFEHRFQIVKREGICFVDDAYNASPLSVKAALDNLPKPEKGRKTIALLGSMKELGTFSRDAHEDVARKALSILDHLLCFGEETEPMVHLFKQEGKLVEQMHTLEEAKKRLKELAVSGDVVLVKGANSLKLWTVLEEKEE